MKNRITNLLIVVTLVFSLFAVVQPVLAETHGPQTGTSIVGTISVVDTTGSTVSITPKKGGADVVLKVDSTTMIKRNNQTAALADLKVGDLVFARYDPTTMLASTISARMPVAFVFGTISVVDTTGSTLSITPKKGGSDVVLKVDTTTGITRNHQTATLADLKVGDLVIAKYDPTTMIAIKIDARMNVVQVTGTISAVDTTGSSVSITPKKGGPDVVLKVDSTTKITLSHKTATLADLQVGDKVDARYDLATMLAIKINASLNLTQVEGTISVVDTTGSTLSITPKKGGADVVLKVDSTTKITRNHQTAALADLKVGDLVEARYNATTLLAVKIDAMMKVSFVIGKISAVDTTASTVSVTPMKGGPDVVLKVDSTTKITRNHQTAALADLVVGDMVFASYDPATMLAIRIDAGGGLNPPHHK